MGQIFKKIISAGVDKDNTYISFYAKATGIFFKLFGVSEKQIASTDYVDIAIAAIPTVVDASDTVKGITKLSVAPASASNPIAVGDNDSRNTDARTPTAHASTHTNGTDDIQNATAAQKGLLTAADWISFDGKQAAGSYEVNTNKATDFSVVNNTLYPTISAAKTYADGLVVGLIDDRGSHDAFGNAYPSSGGSGSAGAILKGDLWFISVAGTLNSKTVEVGDSVRALVDTPNQTNSNWSILETNIGFTPENSANKENTTIDTSTTKYPTVNLLKTGLDTKQATLVSATNIKTINGASILGSGDLPVTGFTAATVSEINTGTSNTVGASPLNLQTSKYGVASLIFLHQNYA